VSAGRERAHAERAERGGARSRVAFVDWLRLVAALQMITGHTLDAVLVDGAREGDVFHTWTQIRGLTAPAFLLASGVSFALASRLEDAGAYAALRAREGARRRRVVRSAWLVVLGTLLHAFDAPWVIDVLQCVGLTLLGLDLVVTLAPRPEHVSRAALVGALAILAVALPIERAIVPEDHGGLARYALGWIDRDGGSLFPLIPWAFYVLTGVVVARLTIGEGARTAARVVVARLVALAIGAGVLAWMADRFLDAPTAATWSSHPAILLGRTGVVLLLAASLAALGARLELPRWATVLAGETLALYVVHLLVLFAEGVGPGRVWAHALSLEASLVLALAMLAGSVAVALGWARVWPPLEARWMPWLRAPRSTLPPDARAAKNGA
jgi:acyltransferase